MWGAHPCFMSHQSFSKQLFARCTHFPHLKPSRSSVMFMGVNHVFIRISSVCKVWFLFPLRLTVVYFVGYFDAVSSPRLLAVIFRSAPTLSDFVSSTPSPVSHLARLHTCMYRSQYLLDWSLRRLRAILALPFHFPRSVIFIAGSWANSLTSTMCFWILIINTYYMWSGSACTLVWE